MASETDAFFQFCGFVANGSSFRTKYFMDESTMTLTPCAELGMTMLQTIPLFFFSITNFYLLERHYPRIERKTVTRIFGFRIFVSVLSAVVLSFPLIFTALNGRGLEMKVAFQIEYGMLALIWFTYAVVWALSLHTQSWTRSTSLVVSAFFASKVFYLVLVNRWIYYGFKDPRTILILVLAVFQTFNSVGGYIEYRLKKKIHFERLGIDSDSDGSHAVVHLTTHGDEGASLLSRILFCWTNQIVKKGSYRQLHTLNDVFLLPPSLQVATIERQMIENSPTFYTDGTQYSISQSLLATFGTQFFLLAILRILQDALTFSGPILLHLLVETFDSPIPSDKSYIYAGLMILCSLGSAITSANFNFYVQKISFKVRAATITAVFDKLTRVSLAEMRAVSSGKMTNFISTDVDCIVNFCNSFHAFWSLPLMILVALYLIYREVGMAFLAGLVCAILLLPVNKVITNMIGKMTERLMNAKDQRIRLIKETMEGIKAVKMSRWEGHFEKKISELRDQEIKFLKMRKYLDAVCVYLWASAPLLITISILATYTVVMHERLTAAKVFTSLALVNILIMPLNAFPWVLNGLVEALVSLRRLQWFFAFDNIDLHDIYSPVQDENILLTLKEGNFFWGDSDATVSGISFTGKKGQIIGVTGKVGSGKSTLLLGLLGETKYLAEEIGVHQELIHEGVGYVGQDRWLSRGSIRDNILSGKPYDPRLYERVLAATCLRNDIGCMPGGDCYEISDNGTSLSGGQRTRVALARAMYQDNSVYILDEPFASLDKKVADSVWQNVIEYLKSENKLVIVATHEQRLLARADLILMLGSDGTLVRRGRAVDVLQPVVESLHLEVASSDDNVELEHIVTQDEEKQEGAVRVSVYKAYGAATGVCLTALILSALSAMQLTKNGADWWLSKWTSSQDFNGTMLDEVPDESNWRDVFFRGDQRFELLSDPEYDSSLKFLYIYAIIAAANTIFTLIRAFLFAFGGIAAAKFLHKSLLHNLMKAPLSWWDRTPAGRVINRLCSDVYTVDDNLPFQLNIFLALFFNVIGSLTVTLIGLPFFAPVLLVLAVMYYLIQRHYRMTTVELKRLTTLTMSPLYSLLTDTVNGLVHIRAQRFTERYANELRQRLTNNLRTQYSSLAASQWLSIRLSLIAVVVVAAITLAAIFQHRFTSIESGLVGLAITYALSMTNMLNGLVGSFIETEKEMVSVERINEYINDVDQESNEGGRVFNYQQVNGVIQFKNTCLRYLRTSPLALDRVTLRFEPGQRVAITGRTGSGKSSIFQALLRLTPLEAGSITLDSVDIREFNLKWYRRLFGVIPQAPFIFSGSLYENLTVDCPTLDRSTVSRIINAANLDSLLHRIGGIDGEIAEGGRNLSAGEKQLIAVCRVLLTKPKVVLIDEATSHMDILSQKLVFSMLAANLPHATLICIVHSLDVAGDFDQTIELDHGRVARIV